ncbi:MAG: maleylpyruvate isomerase N-terminal domain-containing protein [Actinomycetota bacterium]|nr:maleylpyruvate isomerase N-terminal domain-containing protein [Actinomycetota bacterium]
MILDALRIAYLDLATLATSLDEDASWRPTACVGWSVRDLIHHLLSDAQRALVALATPARGPADKDAATYWLDFPGASDAESRGIRATRTMASQWPLKYLTAVFAETTSAVVTLSERAAPSDLVSTQGHVLSVADLLATLVVEASIHHLDMTVEPDCAGPGPEPIGITRRTLDKLLGVSAPTEWADQQWVRAATGRGQLTSGQREFLGQDVARLPLLH